MSIPTNLSQPINNKKFEPEMGSICASAKFRDVKKYLYIPQSEWWVILYSLCSIAMFNQTLRRQTYTLKDKPHIKLPIRAESYRLTIQAKLPSSSLVSSNWVNSLISRYSPLFSSFKSHLVWVMFVQ